MSKKIRVIVALVMVLAFAASVAGCGGSGTNAPKEEPKAADGPIVLHMAATSSPDHSYFRAADIMIDMIDKGTGGKVKAVKEFGGVHGGERQTTEACMRGELDIQWCSDVGLTAAIPSVGFTQMPFLFKDYADVDKRYLNGWMGEVVAKRLEEKGMIVLAFGENDFRALTNSKKPITNKEDLKGMKLRVPEIPFYLDFFKELGTLPTPMAVTELPTALQQKTIDGQDNGAILTWAYGYWQFQKYFTKSNHIYSGMEICISKKTWDKLTPDQQKVVKEAAQAAAKKQVELNRSDVAQFWKNMSDKGVEVIDASPELKNAMQEAAKKVWENPKNSETYGKDIMDRIIKEAAAN
ncbi:MAG: TRAP transporter substrate-binding protein [Firmicutes bacterium]|nr:TRAP transporter substrate-binding protein [Bacillota bacterium]